MTPAEAVQPERQIGTPPADAPQLVLASRSAARRALLANAGVPVIVDAAGVDEDAVKESFRAEGASAAEVAEALAEMKAQRVSPRHAGALVLGCDQMLECDGIWYDKPADRDAARDQLRQLRGKRLRLIVGAVVVRDSARIWQQLDTAELAMRPVSDAFLEAYLDAAGETALESVGAFQLEGLGAQLFGAVRGQYFTVLGLPLLPLLDFLRQHRVIPA